MVHNPLYSNPMKARKIAEAEKQLEDAAKAMKTSFFKRRPDYNAAAICYFEAAQCYYVAEDLPKAIEYYEKSAEIDIQIESYLDGAQKLEKCALLSIQRRDADSSKDARSFYDRCVEQYLFANCMDKAAECYTKVARVVEKENINMSAGYMLKACNLLVNFDRQDFAVDTFNNTLNLLLRIGRFRSAVVLLRRMIALFMKLQQPHNIYKCYLSIVIIFLGCGDLPAAQQEFNKHLQDDEYLRSSEIALEEDIVKACEDFDEDRVEELKNHNQLNFVQQQVNRIGKNIAIATPVSWYCNEDGDLLKQAEGKEDMPVDLAPSPPQGTVKKEGKKLKEEVKPKKEVKEVKEVKEAKPKKEEVMPKEEKKPKEETSLSAREALEQAALNGDDDDDDLNLCYACWLQTNPG